jgi:hypothetical protein
MAPKYAHLITTGPLQLPLYGVLYGVESVGKTTFGDNLPDPVFVGPEKTQKIKGGRFPRPTSWDDFLSQLRDLFDPHYTYKSVVVDSLDHLEQMIIEKIKLDYKVTVVTDAAGKYGNWVGVAQRHWLDMLSLLEGLREKKSMNVLMIAHYHIKVFNDPLTTLPYDRYQMKVNEKCAAIIREAVDFVFFANFKSVSFSSDTKAKKGKGLSDGARVVFTERRASHDAKNRFDMPHEVPFDFNTIMEHIKSGPVDKLVAIQKDIEALMLDVNDPEKLPIIQSFYTENKNDYPTLQNIKNKLKILVGEVVSDT